MYPKVGALQLYSTKKKIVLSRRVDCMRLSPFIQWLGAEYMYSVLTALLPAARPTHFLAPSPDYPAAGPHRLYQGYKGQRRQQVDPYGRPRCHPFGCGAGLTMTVE